MNIYEKYINKDLVDTIDDKFEVELDKYKIYNQKDSLTCWIYAGINTIKRDLSNALNIDENMVDISVNYISFYDRLEKLDMLYDEIINNNYELSNIKYLLFDYIDVCGEFKGFKHLVNKYGIVFENQMPMTENNYLINSINTLLKQKVILDIEELLNKKNSNEDLNKLKDKYMKENFKILSDIFGEPPKETIIGDIKLPVEEFFNKYVKDIINDYVSISSLSNLEYQKNYDINFIGRKIDNEEYLNLDLDLIKNAIKKSLNDNRPVWFGCSFRYMSGSIDNPDGILDDNLYKFGEIGINKLSRSLSEKYQISLYDHAMVFTGYGNNKWQVLNSFGEENNRNGYFIMNDNFFNSSVFIFAINKKYL